MSSILIAGVDLDRGFNGSATFPPMQVPRFRAAAGDGTKEDPSVDVFWISPSAAPPSIQRGTQIVPVGPPSAIIRNSVLPKAGLP